MKELNKGKLSILKEHHEGAFYSLFIHDEDFIVNRYLDSLKSQSQINRFMDKCSKDMLEVDKITKERWLQGEVLETPFTKFVWNGENFSYQLNSSLIRSESQYTKRYKK